MDHRGRAGLAAVAVVHATAEGRRWLDTPDRSSCGVNGRVLVAGAPDWLEQEH